MVDISATLQIRATKKGCDGDAATLDPQVRDILHAAHMDVCHRLHAHGFTVDTKTLVAYLPGERDG